MKVLVYFAPNQKYDHFEGTRLRKSIKGALELNDISYTTVPEDNFDVAHLISPTSDLVLNQIKERNIPIIASALYTEDDPSCSYLDFKRSKEGKREIYIKSKALRFLNKVNLVLVPTESAKQILIEQGVTTPIIICSSGINFARFDFSRDDEKEIFLRYAGISSKKKLVLAVGEYTNNMDGVSSFINAARLCPDADFYYFGSDANTFKYTHIVHKLKRKAPKNVNFKGCIPDDIYRSALINANVMMFVGYNIGGVMSIYDAIAAKCQLIARKQSVYPEIVTDGETGYVAEFSETLSNLVKDFLEGKKQPTTTEAYKRMLPLNLENFGKNLIEIYNQLINQNS